MIAHINIGSNCGHRADNIKCALSAIADTAGSVLAVSAPVESSPWGFDSPNRFINVGANIATSLAPADLLQRLLLIEQQIAPGMTHRNSAGDYIDRIIDIDLICMENLVVSAPSLQLPHPRLHMREFVLTPLAELLPEWVHPQLGLNAEKMIERLHNIQATQGVKLV